MKLQPFRDETLKNPTEFRTRLNELVRRLNETSSAIRHVRIPSVQSGVEVNLADPSFTVGAVLMGGVMPTSGGAAPTSAPWVSDWKQLPSGAVRFTIGGLAAAPAQYAVNIVLVEAGGVV